MRLSIFSLLACLAIVTACGVNWHAQRASELAARRMIEDEGLQARRHAEQRAEVRRGPFAQRGVYLPPRAYPPGYSIEQLDLHYNSNDLQPGMYYQTSPNFEWSRLSMAIVMLVGGTLVCRRIFKTPARSQPIHLRYRSPPAMPVARPRPVTAVDRICPRADCSRMNPPMAKFCRRCGAALNDA